ncbi:MAG: hypothetical protein Q8M74_02045, partial [Chloroflexota bacterium]|nr:hypothetical protein [Chloroflexota bacterium]
MQRGMWLMGALMGLVGGAACSEAEGPTRVGPSLEVAVAALNLVGVGDVVWDLQVVNGRLPTPDVVWQQRIASSRYGDGQGSASYVGTCDASPMLDQNVVRVWVVGVYAQAASDAALGGFGAAPPPGVLAFENPTPYDQGAWASPLSKTTRCEENADAFVRFDVALMRPANPGFFDIAVNFNDVFCSAKFDCCV